MIKSKLKKKLERETFKRKDEILLGGLRYDLMNMHEHSGNPNLKPKPEKRLSFKERSQKHRAYMQIADDVAEAFRSLTLDGLVLLTSKKLDLYELHEQIPNFTRNGIQRDYDMLPNVGSTCDNLVKLHIIGYGTQIRVHYEVNNTCHTGLDSSQIAEYNGTKARKYREDEDSLY